MIHKAPGILSSKDLMVWSISLYRSRKMSIVSKVVATSRPTCPSPERSLREAFPWLSGRFRDAFEGFRRVFWRFSAFFNGF